MWAISEIGNAIARHLQTQISPEGYPNSVPRSNYSTLGAMDPYCGDFKTMTVTFRWTDSPSADPKSPPKPLQADDDRSLIGSIMDFPQDMLSTFYMKTMGVKLIYPGATVMNQVMMAMKIKDMRARLLSQYNGIRGKLVTFDDNHIDSMFVDRRNSSPKGSILIVCCEGNIGYYECGSMWTPIHAGKRITFNLSDTEAFLPIKDTLFWVGIIQASAKVPENRFLSKKSMQLTLS